MNGSASWTRRVFLQSLGSSCAISSLSPFSSPSSFRQEALKLSRLRFAFVASAQHLIHTFDLSSDGSWRLVQQTSSPSPVSLAVSPDQRFLYVANAISSFSHRPSGSIESYDIDPHTGHLSLVNQQALALSATMPRRIAISPNGRLVAVAMEDGATYNLLPTHQDGSIGAVTASLRPRLDAYPLTPCAQLSSAILFNRDDEFLAADTAGRMSALSIDEDLALKINQHHDFTQHGSSLHMVAHPTADLYFVADSHRSTLSVVSRSLQPLQELRLSSNVGVSALAVNPSGSTLFAATSTTISVVSIDSSGMLRVSTNVEDMPCDINVLECSSDSRHLFAMTISGTVFRMQIGPRFNPLSSPRKLVWIPSPTAVAFRYA
jgi:6-phosphogluconolactonase